jgi:hypothetical protein
MIVSNELGNGREEITVNYLGIWTRVKVAAFTDHPSSENKYIGTFYHNLAVI